MLVELPRELLRVIVHDNDPTMRVMVAATCKALHAIFGGWVEPPSYLRGTGRFQEIYDRLKRADPEPFGDIVHQLCARREFLRSRWTRWWTDRCSTVRRFRRRCLEVELERVDREVSMAFWRYAVASSFPVIADLYQKHMWCSVSCRIYRVSEESAQVRRRLGLPRPHDAVDRIERKRLREPVPWDADGMLDAVLETFLDA